MRVKREFSWPPCGWNWQADRRPSQPHRLGGLAPMDEERPPVLEAREVLEGSRDASVGRPGLPEFVNGVVLGSTDSWESCELCAAARTAKRIITDGGIAIPARGHLNLLDLLHVFHTSQLTFVPKV